MRGGKSIPLKANTDASIQIAYDIVKDSLGDQRYQINYQGSQSNQARLNATGSASQNACSVLRALMQAKSAGRSAMIESR